MQNIICPICNKSMNMNGIGKHFICKHNIKYSDYCITNNIPISKVAKYKRKKITKQVQHIVNSNILCEYGCGNIANFILRNGKYCCSKSSNSCNGMKLKNSEGLKKQYQKENRNPMGYEGKVGWSKGLTKETDSRIAKRILSRIEHKNQGLLKSTKGIKLSEHFKQLRREEMLQRYANGFEVQCGRAKKYNYTSSIAGQIKVDGTWELKVAQYLDSLKIKWERNKKRFPYINELGKDATYCPDFYVYDWDCYIEVKGYKTIKDDYKWSQFPNKLEVWNKQKLIELKIL